MNGDERDDEVCSIVSSEHNHYLSHACLIEPQQFCGQSYESIIRMSEIGYFSVQKVLTHFRRSFFISPQMGCMRMNQRF